MKNVAAAKDQNGRASSSAAAAADDDEESDDEIYEAPVRTNNGRWRPLQFTHKYKEQ